MSSFNKVAAPTPERVSLNPLCVRRTTDTSPDNGIDRYKSIFQAHWVGNPIMTSSNADTLLDSYAALLRSRTRGHPAFLLFDAILGMPIQTPSWHHLWPLSWSHFQTLNRTRCNLYLRRRPPRPDFRHGTLEVHEWIYDSLLTLSCMRASIV